MKILHAITTITTSTTMSVCVCVWKCMYYFVGTYTYLGYSLKKVYTTRFVKCLKNYFS